VQNANQEYTYKSVVMYTAFYYIRHYNGVLWQLYWPLNFFLHSIIFFPPHKVHVRRVLSLRVKFHSSFKQVFPRRSPYIHTYTPLPRVCRHYASSSLVIFLHIKYIPTILSAVSDATTSYYIFFSPIVAVSSNSPWISLHCPTALPHYIIKEHCARQHYM